ncbi:MAG: DNA methyltransferase [Candidatus Thermoplasmatota archaeon]|nr:DNA methyltransferase [Candidatus Thermoplasmatota archaeon]
MKNNSFISSVWDFRQTRLDETNYITHDFFRWYGKLIPQLVSRLIKLYSKERDLVLANFAGSGTVLLESNLLKRDSIGIDSNPLSILLCKVKTTPFMPNSEKFLLNLEKYLSSDEKKRFGMDKEDKKWFDERVFQDLMNIKSKIDEIPIERERNYYLLALAGVVRKVSRIDSRCINHIVVNKNKPVLNVFLEFKNKIHEMNSSMSDYIRLATNSKIEIKRGDARNLKDIKDNSIDLIISHPPYLGYINYSNIFKLSNKILGYAYGEVKQDDISTNSISRYIKDMKKAFDEAWRIIKPKKYTCVIIGDNRVNGEIIPTSSYFINYGLEKGFKLKDIFIWVMSQKAGMSIKRRGNYVDHNYILIFRKP